MSFRKVLYFMPYNPMENNSGSATRTLQLLEYFNNHPDEIVLDYVGMRDRSKWHGDFKSDFKERFNHCNIYVFYRKLYDAPTLNRFFNYTIPNLFRKIKRRKQIQGLRDQTTALLQKQFDDLVKKNKYHLIIMSYVEWAPLIENNPLLKNTKTIIDTHDFFTAQNFEKPGFDFGKTFRREMEILSNFDEIWSISADERYIFSQFVKSKHFFVPIMFDRKYSFNDIKEGEYDIIYVAGDNQHNIKSANWFFIRVYPLLPPDLKICVVGAICNHIPFHKNVIKINFAPSLDTYYQNSKVSICPMLSGTGLKIKVVEALSFGLPVVCTFRGLDGLPAKFDNGCLMSDDPTEFAGYILRLLSDNLYYNKVAAAGINIFESFFEKEKCYAHLDKILGLRSLATPPKSS